ncbi:polysaccharide deacetylase family protein [Thalassovita sp.]|jgi:peptidoglycan/xylan/chitin deacetylase (PgdA/CDA1 family)|uniref:polysaccharide deacetylase family protein n=1 Tax=Thalassovita sp. TaxID=1979401 RepID=UPI003B5CCCA7
MSGRLVISLDFELMWGVRDHRSVAGYGDAVLGARKAIPQILSLFSQHGINATWATVGLLFARTRDEMHAFAPSIRPSYDNATLSPYPALDQIGATEAADPLHFGRSLLDQIAATPGQEIATHTFGHVYALEPGMTPDAWRADLQAAIAIARQAGHQMRSIVFPRNQMGAQHVSICQELGLTVIRGNAPGAVYRPRSGDELTLSVRALRYLDGALPLLGSTSFELPGKGAVVDVPASRFLRPWNPRFPLYSSLHQRRIKREMTQAAKAGKGYHLWWHPHNMGRDTQRNMDQLDAILSHFSKLRARFDFQSVSMGAFGGSAC